MISVIVPVYNARSTVRQCVDSILSQTYADLEVLLIDDGSTDHSGRILDTYGAEEQRVTVFHKENGGLSSARNYGLDRASGEYCAFVDADDWLEADAFETVIRQIGDADICICGHSRDYLNRKKVLRPAAKAERIDGDEAIRRLIVDGSVVHIVGDKVYRRELFHAIRFPEGYNYEDSKTTYKLLQQARSIVLIPDVCYHYMQYKNSIVRANSVKNRLDHWTSYYGLYQAFCGRGEEYRKACVKRCAISMILAWGSLWKSTEQEREREKERIGELPAFGKPHGKECPKTTLRLGTALVAAGTRWSMLLTYLLNGCYGVLHYQRLYSKE